MAVIHPYFLLSIVGSSLLWSSLYFLIRVFTSERTPEFTNRIVTFFHGLAMAIWGARECFVDGWIFSYSEMPINCTQEFALVVSLGYFVFDLMWCLYYKTETNLMIGHHIYSIFALCRLLVKRRHWGQAGCALGGMEATNPLLQMRWFIRTYGKHSTPLFAAVECIFVFSFIVLRIFVGTFIMWFVMFTGTYDLEFRMLAVLIYIVSWAFVYNMLSYMQKKYLIEEIDPNSNASPIIR